MTPEAQRIAIAEACGWIQVTTGKWFSPTDQKAIDEKRYGDALDGSKLPNYPSDLNAMHEAEKILTNDQFLEYFDYLDMAIRKNTGFKGLRPPCVASASDRAEAFLHTLNLWTDE